MLLIICKVYEVRNIFKAFYHAWWVMDRRVANSILILRQKYLQKKIEFVISLSKIRLFFYWIPKCFPTNNWMCKYLNLVVHKKPESSLCTENAIKTIFSKKFIRELVKNPRPTFEKYDFGRTCNKQQHRWRVCLLTESWQNKVVDTWSQKVA